MDPSSPPQSRSKRQGHQPEQQTRKKVRGRPLKNSDSSNVPEQYYNALESQIFGLHIALIDGQQERRAQIRRAQEAFRLRKLAATRSLESRVKSLEACVQDMSTIFLDLSESMIQSDVLQQDPAVAQNLVTATSKFIMLAKAAVDESESAADAAPESVLPSSDLDTTLSQQRPASGNPSCQVHHRRSSPVFPAPEFPVPEDFNPVPATLLKKDVFGNGWFGLQPEILSKLSSTNGDMDRLDSSFGVKLLQTTLSIAYDYLMDPSGPRYDTAMNMYQFALLYHTKQELLFNLRWFLGSGIRALRPLGRAVFGFGSSLSLQYLNAISSGTEPKILNPLVDALALVEVQKKYPTIQYLNAFDVEDYIISKGAFHIDQDIIRLKVSDDDRLNPGWSGNIPGSYTANHSTMHEEMSGYLPTTAENFPSESEFPSISNFPSGSDVSTSMPNDQILNNSWSGILNFNGDTQEGNHSTNMSLRAINQNPPVRNIVRTLSVPVLLQNLAKGAQ